MRLLLLALASVCLAVRAEEAEDGLIVVEEGVLVLTDDNFQKAIEANSQILVEFYAPWCGHCKKLAPEYAAAAGQLSEKGLEVKLAKVDATENKDIAQKFGVKGYPTLKYFKAGVAQEYTGGRTADTIVSWLTKKSGPPAASLENMDAVKNFLGDNSAVVVGLFKNLEGEEAKAFLAAAEEAEDLLFGITSAEDAFAGLDITADASVVVLKKFDEGRSYIDGPITKESVELFAASNSLPLVVDFNTDTAKQIFQGAIKNHLLMFMSAEAEDYEHKLHQARKVAADMKGDIMFVTVTTDEPEHKRVLEFFGISDDEVPTFRLSAGDDMTKYKPDNKAITEENLRAFIAAQKAGELKPNLKSDPIPEENTAPVKVIVGENFNDIALDASKDVLVEFYAPWCGHCKKLAPIWDELGEKFKDSDKIVIAKTDATTNEFADVKIRGFPTIKLFKAGTNEVVDYKGGRTLEDFVKFLAPEEANEEAPKDEL